MRNDPEGTVLGVPRRAVQVPREGCRNVTTELLQVVVLSREPVPATSLLRSEFPACLPVTVRSVKEIASQLLPEAIVLLDLGDGGDSVAVARGLRQRGIRQGIVAIDSSAADELTGVISLSPPFQLDELGAAMQQAREHSAGVASERTQAPEGAAPVGPPQPPAPPVAAQTGPPMPPPSGLTPVRRDPTTDGRGAALAGTSAGEEGRSGSHVPVWGARSADPAGDAEESLRSKVARWRRKRIASSTAEVTDEPTEQELHERLVQVFAAAAQVESIAAELPIVIDRMALSRAVVMAVGEEFAADTVVLWRRGENGWVGVAHRGLTGREASLPVGFEQPLLRDVEARSGAILLEPTVSFQNLISGIGGAHKESFMAAAVTLGSRSLGILAVGRDEPLVEADLERLVEMAAEAAVGIGIAEHVERMSDFGGQVGGGRAGSSREPEHWRTAFLEELDAAWHARGRDDAAPGASVAGADWSVVAAPDGQPAAQGKHEGGAGGDKPDTVIDLTSQELNRA